MNKPRKLQKGDKVAIVSLSSGMLGEDFCRHNIEIGTRRLKEYGLEPVFMPNTLKGISYLAEHPEARASDLKQAFMEESIAGIICAIGGDDTYRLLPYLMEDFAFKQAVQNNPKLFTGFSDTTINHLMLYQLGLQTYYGPNFICDLGELANEMLPYTKEAFESYLEGSSYNQICSSPIWYEERKDFSSAAIGTDRIAHKEERGYELLQGPKIFSGELLGGCLESMYDILEGTRYTDEREICERYHLFPNRKVWDSDNNVLPYDTSSLYSSADAYSVGDTVTVCADVKMFTIKTVEFYVNGILAGKPQDETYYEEYKELLKKVVHNDRLPIVYNVNFGHALPRCALPIGAEATVDMMRKTILFG